MPSKKSHHPKPTDPTSTTTSTSLPRIPTPTRPIQSQSQSQTQSQSQSQTPTQNKSSSSSSSAGGSGKGNLSHSQLSQNLQSPQQVALGVWRRYVEKTPQRLKLIDVFLGFLVGVGVVQFLYCLGVGNYPFNAFLSGFSATVGQFVLTASLRIQTNPENKADFHQISPERAFADFVFGSLILHFFCVNFIN